MPVQSRRTRVGVGQLERAASRACREMVLVLALVTNVALIAGQSVPTPARSIPTDQAVLQGRVVEIGSGLPVANAAVQAMNPDGRSEATTNADGRYEIASMKPGTYTVVARARGFVDGYFGQSAAGASGSARRSSRGLVN